MESYYSLICSGLIDAVKSCVGGDSQKGAVSCKLQPNLENISSVGVILKSRLPELTVNWL